MKIIKKRNYEEVSEETANIILSTMSQDKQVNVSLTGGSSPKRTYEIIADKVNENSAYLANTNFFNFDEVVLGGKEDRNYVQKVMGELIYDKIKVDPAKLYAINDENYQQYDKIIEELGGLDVMLLGLGNDGHFCGNMPYTTPLASETYRFKISKEYPWYQTFIDIFGEDMPEDVYSMGPLSIQKVKRIVLMISGKNKAEATKQFFESEVTNEFPASVLKLHSNFTVILDEEAAQLVDPSLLK